MPKCGAVNVLMRGCQCPNAGLSSRLARLFGHSALPSRTTPRLPPQPDDATPAEPGAGASPPRPAQTARTTSASSAFSASSASLSTPPSLGDGIRAAGVENYEAGRRFLLPRSGAPPTSAHCGAPRVPPVPLRPRGGPRGLRAGRRFALPSGGGATTSAHCGAPRVPPVHLRLMFPSRRLSVLHSVPRALRLPSLRHRGRGRGLLGRSHARKLVAGRCGSRSPLGVTCLCGGSTIAIGGGDPGDAHLVGTGGARFGARQRRNQI